MQILSYPPVALSSKLDSAQIVVPEVFLSEHISKKCQKVDEFNSSDANHQTELPNEYFIFFGVTHQNIIALPSAFTIFEELRLKGKKQTPGPKKYFEVTKKI